MGILCTDAGHGGPDSGAVWNDVAEKSLNLAYAMALNEELKQRGHTVFTTRKTDVGVPPLRTRCRLINDHHRSGSPVFDGIVSLHCNVAASLDPQVGRYRAIPSARGLYCIYSEESKPSETLASCISRRCHASGVTLNHGGMVSTVQLGRALAWIHQTLPPATLVELGFMTNPEELGQLQDASYRATLVGAIADGIEAFLASG